MTPSSSWKQSSTTSSTALSPHDATLKAMEQVSGPVVAIALILTAVFVPTALHPGHHRPPLPAVRRHDRLVGDHLGVQRAVAQPGAGGHAAARARKRAARWESSSDGSTGFSARATDGYVSYCGLLIRRAGFAMSCSAGIVAGHRPASAGVCRPAFCPKRTRATST